MMAFKIRKRRIILMNNSNNYINTYLEYCKFRKRLDNKTLKAYKILHIDLNLFCMLLEFYYLGVS